MAALWTLNGNDIFVTTYTGRKPQFVANNVPLGETLPERQWSGSISQKTIIGTCSTTARNAIMALSGASSYTFTGPGSISITVSVDDAVDQRLRDGILDGVTGPIWLLTIQVTVVA